ncbi:MAG: 2'-5' RNA ligase family protein [Sulfobacillus sp.]
MEGNALIIPVQLPEPLEAIRQQYDPVGCTIPAHITVSYPFAGPSEQARMSLELTQLASQFDPFVAKFHQLSQFDQGEQAIVILRLRHSRHLMHLFDEVWTRFAQYPPYQGQHRAIIPHITIARLSASSMDMFGQVSQMVNAYQSQLSWRVNHLMWVISGDALQVNPRQFIFPFKGVYMP